MFPASCILPLFLEIDMSGIVPCKLCFGIVPRDCYFLYCCVLVVFLYCSLWSLFLLLFPLSCILALFIEIVMSCIVPCKLYFGIVHWDCYVWYCCVLVVFWHCSSRLLCLVLFPVSCILILFLGIVISSIVPRKLYFGIVPWDCYVLYCSL